MAAWTTISNGLVAVGAKPFATTIQALRDNPIAIAEGAANAPKVVGPAVSVTRPSRNISGTTPAGWTDLDRVKIMRFDFWQTTGAFASDIQARFSTNNGGSWGSYQSLGFGMGTNQSAVGTLWLDITNGDYEFYATRFATSSGNPIAVFNTGSVTVPSNANGLQFRNSTGSGTPTLNIRGVILEGISP
jgi:hypothetical protein